MIKSFGHQTIFKSFETIEYRLRKGPVLSLMVDMNGDPKEMPPFAGEGYYFWEDNIDAADWWGNVHYIKKGLDYRVFRVDLELRYDNDSFLDLIGNRQHLKFLERLVEKTRKNIDCTGWKLHNYIAYFRKRATERREMFPYKIVRFNDYNLNPKIQSSLRLSDKQNKFLLNPFYIVCVFELDAIDLKSFIFIK